MNRNALTTVDKLRIAMASALTPVLGVIAISALKEESPKRSEFELEQIQDIKRQVRDLEPGQTVIHVMAGQGDSPWSLVKRVQDAIHSQEDPRPAVDDVTKALGNEGLQPTQLVDVNIADLR